MMTMDIATDTIENSVVTADEIIMLAEVITFVTKKYVFFLN